MDTAFERIGSLGCKALRAARNSAMALILASSALSAETITVAALGDSLTQGYGLPADQGFVPQLQAWLEGQGADVTVINAGVSGDTTAGGLARVGWTLTPEVDAMIVALGGNDFLRGIGPEVARANLDGILAAAQSAGVEVLLVGMEATNNYGPAYKRDFDAIYPDLAQAYDVPLFPTFFDGLRGAGDTLQEISAYMQADGIHPNADGVGLIVEAMGPAVLALAQGAE